MTASSPARTADAGICLSGGGLRAAAFSLGVLQVLQAQRGLLFGSRAAKWLAAVSGGSYIAGAHVLGGRRRAAHPARYAGGDPLAEGTPEERHVLQHARYLLDAPWRWPLLWGLTFASLLALYIWMGFIVADFAALNALLPDDVEGRLGDLPPAIAVVGAVAGMALAAWGLYAGSPLRGSVVGLGGMALVFATSGDALEWLSGLEVFAHGEEAPVAAGLLVIGALLVSLALVPRWWPLRVLGCAVALAVAIATLIALWRLARGSDMLRAAGVVLMAVAVLAAVAMPLRRVRALGLPGTMVNLFSAFAIRLLGGILLVAVAVDWYPDVRAAVLGDPALDGARFGVALAATLLAPVVFAGLPARASLHREYRQRLESCFGVARCEGGAAERVRSALLSPAPPEEPAHRFPRLLVCATANVRGRGSDGRRWRFQPFVLSHNRCGVPGDVDAGFSTSQLELGEAPAGLLTRRKEPLVSLFTAVAATGAAVSPSMGRYTVPSLRPILAALNFRLGRWIPNPYSARARAAVAARTTPGRFDRRRRLGSGYDELVPEMLGFEGPRIYLSDGGHYDNLGLLGLLEQRPGTVWCVDASPDPHGRAAELRRVVGVARSRGIEIDVDCDAFAAGTNGLYGATHATGTVTYAGGAQAQLVVLKLGLVAASDGELLARRRWRGFPFHPTARQIYDEDRMDAYRRLGREVAARAIPEVAPDP